MLLLKSVDDLIVPALFLIILDYSQIILSRIAFPPKIIPASLLSKPLYLTKEEQCSYSVSNDN